MATRERSSGLKKRPLSVLMGKMGEPGLMQGRLGDIVQVPVSTGERVNAGKKEVTEARVGMVRQVNGLRILS